MNNSTLASRGFRWTVGSGAYGCKNKWIICKLAEDTVLLPRKILRDEIVIIATTQRRRLFVYLRTCDTKKREHCGVHLVLAKKL